MLSAELMYRHGVLTHNILYVGQAQKTYPFNPHIRDAIGKFCIWHHTEMPLEHMRLCILAALQDDPNAADFWHALLLASHYMGDMDTVMRAAKELARVAPEWRELGR